MSMIKTKQRRRVRCGGCDRRMYQNAPANRDYQGKSWHYECLSNACGSMRDYYRAKWSAAKKRHAKLAVNSGLVENYEGPDEMLEQAEAAIAKATNGQEEE